MLSELRSSHIPVHENRVLCVLQSDVPISSKWLQLLAFALAEICSAASLLDDYVRAILNISHHLFSAWHSIAMAASCGHALHVYRGDVARCPETRGCSSLSEMLRTWNAKKGIAFNNVEFARKLVVMALVQQFLQVTVTESFGDLKLRPLLLELRRSRWRWMGKTRFKEHKDAGDEGVWSDSGKRTTAPSSSSTTSEEKRKTNEPQKQPRFHRSQEFREGATEINPQVMKGWISGSFNSHDEEEGDDAFPINLHLLVRAAATLDPTESALRLISGCFIRARDVRSCDESDRCPSSQSCRETDIQESSSAGDGDELYYIVVASRAIGACKHSVGCFGNCKFFFIRCTSPGEDESFCHEKFRAKLMLSEPAVVEAGAMVLYTPTTSSVNTGVLSVKTDARGRLTWFPGRSWVNLSPVKPNTPLRARGGSVPAVTYPGFSSFAGPESDGIEPDAFATTPSGAGENTPVKCGMSPQQFYDEGRDYYSSEYDDKVKNDDDDEEQVPWHVLYSSRCSKTDSFFTAESPTLRPLLTSSQENSLSDLSTVTQFTHDFFDRELSLGMAISIPLNAGYGVYNGGDHSNSPKEFIGLTEALESGQRVFFEELIAHMEFWSARGEPRRVYYDPAVLNAEQGESVPFSGDVSGNELDRSGDFCTPMVDEMRGKDPATNTIPLKLLLTRVGAAQFQPQGDTLYCDPRGRELLFRALNEATELVICAARESRSHRGWHDHKQCKSCEEPAGRGRKGCRARKQRGDDTAKGTATLSAKIRNSISMTCYTNVAVEVLIHWAQGEVDKDEEDDDCSVTQAESIENHTAYPRNNRSRGSRLSAREQQQRKLERLRMEFRLANSSRLDALLIDGRNAKPLASLILVPSTTNSQHGGSPLKIVSDTKFVVQTFSHYVGQLLRHIKEEKMIMVDMDRTLVDNAIVTNSDIAKGLFNASSRVVRAVRVVRPNATKEDPTLLQDGIERHCEAFQHVSYFMKDDPSHKMRTEMIFVRRGVRRLLRQLTVEWGIPLVVVTKSSFRRTEAILKQLFDPRQELFPTVDQHVYAAEFVVQSSISAGTSINNLTLTLSGSDSDQTCGVGQQDEPEWNNFQRCLLRSKKSARNVLRAWDQRNNLGKKSGSPQRARSVAVLDDMPHLWERSDWPRTVAIAPYTLNRVDPVGYFSSGGLITSLLLSTLYSRKSMVCPVEVCGSTLDREEVSGGVVDGEALETGPEVVSRGCGQMDDLDAFEGEAVESWPDDSSYLSEISDGELMEASGVRIRLVTPDFSDAECLGCAPDELNSTVVIEEEL